MSKLTRHKKIKAEPVKLEIVKDSGYLRKIIGPWHEIALSI